MLRDAAALLPAVLLLIGCTGAEPERPANTPRAAPAPPAARATLRLAVVPERNIFAQLDRYEPLTAYLGSRCGVLISLRVLQNYGDALPLFAAGELDGAFLGSFIYVLGHERFGLLPVARPESADGTSTYRGLLLVRKDAGISSLKQLRGRRLALVDRGTTAGYLFPLSAFAREGVTDMRRFLGEAYFAGTHEAAIADVLARRADACAAKSTVLAAMSEREPQVAEALTVLARSEAVPENALVVAPGVPSETVVALRRELLAMSANAEGRAVLAGMGAARFVPTTEEDYAPVYSAARAAGVDLATFDPEPR